MGNPVAPLLGGRTAREPVDDAAFMEALRFVMGQEAPHGQPLGEALRTGQGGGEATSEWRQRHPEDDPGRPNVSEADRTRSALRMWRDLWAASGSPRLPKQLGLIHFDSAVQHGGGTARRLLRESGGDPERYLQLREAYYRSLTAGGEEGGVAENPGWLGKRMPALRAAVGLNTVSPLLGSPPR